MAGLQWQLRQKPWDCFSVLEGPGPSSGPETGSGGQDANFTWSTSGSLKSPSDHPRPPWQLGLEKDAVQALESEGL